MWAKEGVVTNEVLCVCLCLCLCRWLWLFMCTNDLYLLTMASQVRSSVRLCISANVCTKLMSCCDLN